MPVISTNTFDPLRRYVSVRLAQGVPLVDADWNEMEDIRRFELRAFLKWFVGDGVPAGNDGFRVVAIDASDSFTVTGGGGTDPLDAGRILIDGAELFATADFDFASQPLHTSQPGSTQLAALLGVPQIAPLPAPPAAPGTRTLTVYLDSWERLVTAEEDPSLVHPGLGTESCSRLRRESAVRVREGDSPPLAGDPDHLSGHSYLALSEIVQDATGIITADHVRDLRRRGVSLPSQMDFTQVVRDTFGSGYDADGTGIPKLSFPLRDVMNALLQERPAVIGPEDILTDGPHNTPAALIDAGGTPWVFWIRAEGGARFLSFSRYLGGAWTASQDAFTIAGVLSVSGLAVAAQPDGTIRVFYTAQAGNQRVFSHFFDGSWGPREEVETVGNNSRPTAAVDASGAIVVVWQRVDGGTTLARSRVYPLGAPPGPVEDAGTLVNPAGLSLMRDQSGGPLLFYIQRPEPLVPDWPVHSKRRLVGGWEPAFAPTGISVPVSSFIDPVSGLLSDGVPWLFYTTQGEVGASLLRARRMTSGSPEVRELLPPGGTPRFPGLVVDADGNAQLFFRSGNLLQRVGLVQHV